MIKKLSTFSESIDIIDKKLNEETTRGYVLLKIYLADATLHSKIFSESENEEATVEYIKAEKEAASKKNLVVTLVSAGAVRGLKKAYPNYFADSTEFIELLTLITTAKY